MEERESSDERPHSIKKPSKKYKEDNPQAPDKSEVKISQKSSKKAVSKKNKAKKSTASSSQNKKKKGSKAKPKKRDAKRSQKSSERGRDLAEGASSDMEGALDVSSNSANGSK